MNNISYIRKMYCNYIYSHVLILLFWKRIATSIDVCSFAFIYLIFYFYPKLGRSYTNNFFNSNYLIYAITICIIGITEDSISEWINKQISCYAPPSLPPSSSVWITDLTDSRPPSHDSCSPGIAIDHRRSSIVIIDDPANNQTNVTRDTFRNRRSMCISGGLLKRKPAVYYDRDTSYLLAINIGVNFRLDPNTYSKLQERGDIMDHHII